jgi:hypothetical protein
MIIWLNGHSLTAARLSKPARKIISANISSRREAIRGGCFFARYCSEIVEQFIVEPSEPQGGVGRFDLGENVCFFRYVGLRSQSLADPTLRYRALSGEEPGTSGTRR